MLRQVPMRDYTPLAKAIELFKANVKVKPRRESISVLEASSRVLAETVVAKENVPLHDSSRMDGFAVRAMELEGASEERPVRLSVKEGLPLGRRPAALAQGEAYSVLTGGYLPEGADAVVPIERVSVEKGFAVFASEVEVGDDVFRTGADVSRGSAVIQGGTTLRAPEVGLLASLRIGRVSVFVKPRIAVIPTGSELTDEIEGSPPEKTVESHTHILARLIEEAGGVPIRFPIASDNSNKIERTVRNAARTCDAVLTLAGSSVGKPDLVEEAINRAGKPGVLIHGIRIHRGRVVGFGFLGSRPVIIMPGPIQGAMNAFALFAYPLIRTFLGHPFEEPPTVTSVLSEDWHSLHGFDEFTKIMYVRTDVTRDGLASEPIVGETEKLSLFVNSNGYVIVPEGVSSLRKGEKVSVHLLPGFSYLGARFLARTG